MQDVVIDLGSNNVSIYIKDNLVLTDKLDNITYKDIKKVLKKAKIRMFNSKIVLAVLDKENIKLPRKIRISNKQEMTLLKNSIDINKASATSIIYIDDSLINISIYALGKRIFTKTINKRNKSSIKKIINSLDEAVLSSIKEKGIILTGNVSLDSIYKELKKDLNIPLFIIDNYV